MNPPLSTPLRGVSLDELILRARRIAVAMRARAERCEELRHVPDETISDLIESGLLRIGQPARFGGSELGWDALCKTSLEIARGDGSQAWVANIYAEHAYVVALFPDETQHEVWDDNADALLAASIVPQGNRAERMSGGDYNLSGRWSFTSGVHHAEWVLLSEMSADADGNPDHRYFLVSAKCPSSEQSGRFEAAVNGGFGPSGFVV
jgi:3-hydroxy-9,10-secoandrosta-1,3,5(10)-triene-9,17-dione monooxygenase